MIAQLCETYYYCRGRTTVFLRLPVFFGGKMFENILNHWNAILKFIKEEFDLTDISYETFLVPLKPLQLENGTLYIVASDNPAMVNIISKKYRDFLKVAIEAVAKVQTDVVFICDQDADS